ESLGRAYLRRQRIRQRSDSLNAGPLALGPARRRSERMIRSWPPGWSLCSHAKSIGNQTWLCGGIWVIGGIVINDTSFDHHGRSFFGALQDQLGEVHQAMPEANLLVFREVVGQQASDEATRVPCDAIDLE